jgi:hypothetical protein
MDFVNACLAIESILVISAWWGISVTSKYENFVFEAKIFANIF